MVLSITAYAQNCGIKSNSLFGTLTSSSDTKFTLIDQSLLNISIDYNSSNFNSSKKLLPPLSEQYCIGEYDIPLLLGKKLSNEIFADKVGVNQYYHEVLNNHWGMKFNIKLQDTYMDKDTYFYMEKSLQKQR